MPGVKWCELQVRTASVWRDLLRQLLDRELLVPLLLNQICGVNGKRW
jgi:hypothetical protein